MSLNDMVLESRQIVRLMWESGSLCKIVANVIDNDGAYVIDNWDIRRRVYVATRAIQSISFVGKICTECDGRVIHWTEINECPQCGKKLESCTCAQEREYKEACNKAMNELEARTGEVGDKIQMPETFGPSMLKE